MKQVKELCMVQLKELSDKQISEAIANSSVPSSLKMGADSNEKQLGSQKQLTEHSDGDMGGVASSEAKAGSSVGSENTKLGAQEEEEREGEIVINVSDVSASSVDSDPGEDSGNIAMEEDRLTMFSHHSGLDKECAETSLNIHLSSTTEHDKTPVGEKQKEEGAVSSMTIDRDEVSSKMDTEMRKQEDDGHVSGEGRDKETGSEKGKRTRPPCLEMEPKKGDLLGEKSRTVNEVEEDSPVIEKRTLAASQFLEMELRRRALEAELRRTNGGSTTKRSGGGGANSGQSSTLDSGGVDGEEARDQGDTVCKDTRAARPDGHREVGDHVTQGSSGGGGGGAKDVLQVRELLEERLRQRALQAMLRAKKNNTKT